MVAGWSAASMAGPIPVSAETAQHVRERLTSQGAICLMPNGPPPELEAVAGFFHSFDDLDFEFEGMMLAEPPS